MKPYLKTMPHMRKLELSHLFRKCLRLWSVYTALCVVVWFGSPIVSSFSPSKLPANSRVKPQWPLSVATQPAMDVATRPALDVEFLPLTSPEQVFDCAALCIEVFFNEGNNNSFITRLPLIGGILRTSLLRQLYRKLANVMLQALNTPHRCMIHAVDKESRRVIGYGELHLSDKVFVFDDVTKRFQPAVSPDATLSSSNADPEFSMPKIINLVVVPSARQFGVGRALLTRLMSTARDWGYDEVYLTVEPDNKAAMAFYLKMGFGVRAITEGKTWDVDGLRLRQSPRLLTVMMSETSKVGTPSAPL